MLAKPTRTKIALAAVLAGALALPGLAAAHGDDHWRGGHRDRGWDKRDWHGHDRGWDRRDWHGHDRGRRDWHDRDQARWHPRYDRREVIVERPVYRMAPPPPPRPYPGNGVSVILNRSW